MDTKNKVVGADTSRGLLRHAVATLAYRGAKALRGAPAGFADFRAGATTRTPGQILAHMGDLLDWGLLLAEGKQEWHDSPPLPWDRGKARFFASLEVFDRYLASDVPLGCTCETLLQAPIADALTHVGQIAMLRRIAGAQVRAENYGQAEIVPGRVGADQSAPKMEFD
jgi:hypothetical protein